MISSHWPTGENKGVQTLRGRFDIQMGEHVDQAYFQALVNDDAHRPLVSVITDIGEGAIKKATTNDRRRDQKMASER